MTKKKMMMRKKKSSQNRGHKNLPKAKVKTEMRVPRKKKPRKHPSKAKSSKEKPRHLLLLSPRKRKLPSPHVRSQPLELLQELPLKKKRKRLQRGRNPPRKLMKSQEKEGNMWLNQKPMN